MLARHWFVSEQDGGLYDTRRADWARKAVRPVYERTFREINNVAQLLATLRAGDTAWPGGYPLYLVTDYGCALHFHCVRENLRAVSEAVRRRWADGWRVVGCDINYENAELHCDHCSQPIPSAYGAEPNACPKCDRADAVRTVEGDFPTGVTAPDGGREMRWQQGLYCGRCDLAFGE